MQHRDLAPLHGLKGEQTEIAGGNAPSAARAARSVDLGYPTGSKRPDLLTAHSPLPWASAKDSLATKIATTAGGASEAPAAGGRVDRNGRRRHRNGSLVRRWMHRKGRGACRPIARPRRVPGSRGVGQRAAARRSQSCAPFWRDSVPPPGGHRKRRTASVSAFDERSAVTHVDGGWPSDRTAWSSTRAGRHPAPVGDKSGNSRFAYFLSKLLARSVPALGAKTSVAELATTGNPVATQFGALAQRSVRSSLAEKSADVRPAVGVRRHRPITEDIYSRSAIVLRISRSTLSWALRTIAAAPPSPMQAATST